MKPTGRIEALRVEPKPTLKIVAHNKGRMWFWIGDNDRHLPLQVVSGDADWQRKAGVDQNRNHRCRYGRGCSRTNAPVKATLPRIANKD